MNVFIIGDIRGAYRTEQAVKLLAGQKDVHIYVNDMRASGFVGKVFRKLSSTFAMVNADVVYVAPCQQNNSTIRTAKRLGKPIVTDFYISFYDTEVFDRKNCKEGSKKANKWKKIDLFAMEHSKKLLFLNQSEADYYCQVLGKDSKTLPVSIVPLCTPQRRKAKLSFFHGESEKIHFCWCGTYIPLQALEKILEGAAIAKSRGLDFQLTLWGDSDKKAKAYHKLIEKYHMGSYVTMINDKWGDLEAWTSYIAQHCDVSFGIFGDSRKAKTVLANKVMDGIAFGTPVLTGHSDGLEEYFDDSLLYISENTPEAIAESMIRIAGESKEEILRRVNGAYEIYEQTFTPEPFARKLLAILREVSGKKK